MLISCAAVPDGLGATIVLTEAQGRGTRAVVTLGGVASAGGETRSVRNE
jgi:hypothetical protein